MTRRELMRVFDVHVIKSRHVERFLDLCKRLYQHDEESSCKCDLCRQARREILRIIRDSEKGGTVA
jgi:hypothetical protein